MQVLCSAEQIGTEMQLMCGIYAPNSFWKGEDVFSGLDEIFFSLCVASGGNMLR